MYILLIQPNNRYVSKFESKSKEWRTTCQDTSTYILEAYEKVR